MVFSFLTFTKVKVFRNFVICNWITNVLLVQSQHQKHQNNMWNLFKANNKQNRTKSLTLLLTLNRFHTFFWCFCCCLCISKSCNTFEVLQSNKKVWNLIRIFYFMNYPFFLIHLFLSSSHQRGSVKKVFLKISQNLQKKTCAGVSF